MATAAWSEQATRLAALDSTQRERTLRQWGRYFDSVFEQVYGYLARESELHGEVFAEELRTKGAALIEATALVEPALEQIGLRSAGWPRAQRSIQDRWDDLVRASLVEPRATGGGVDHAAPNKPVHPIHNGETEGDSPSAHADAKGIVSDVGTADAGTVDAGTADAGTVDAGTVDAGTVDAGTVDAGTVDAGTADMEMATLRVSERFWLLRRRMTALETLLKSEDYEKARVVVRDLEETLGAFDVASYFPGLFAPFFELSARYSEALSTYGERDPLRGAALLRLYQSDLGRFMKLRLGEDR
ncbi:MAG: hypothetical protein QM784_22025 [Polyangiaceae bacterium]